MANFYISTFYLFKPNEDVEAVKLQLEQKAEELGVFGLVILASEGINSTFSAPSKETQNVYKSYVSELFASEISFKDSESEEQPYRMFKVKIRPEIVTIDLPKESPQNSDYHLSPSEWNEVLKNENDFVMFDTRNWYETKLGKFKGAVDPNIDKFTEFPDYVEKQNLPKDKKMLIYCTGGIRCEKGILKLQEMGYKNVYQLDGGILKYLEEFPNDEYEGECFVFDRRVAVDQELKPTTKAQLCPHSGQPANVEIECSRCGYETLIAEEVVDDPVKGTTCSKNCAYLWNLKPGVKGRRQEQTY